MIITTIQKLRLLLSPDKRTEGEDIKEALSEEAKKRKTIIIMDECHRSQTDEAHKLLRNFEDRYIFGFTGTPKLTLKGKEDNETRNIFGEEIHKYKIVDAIQDENVLKFRIDYVGDRRPLEEHSDRNVLESESRIASIVQYILGNFRKKTNPNANYDAETLEKFNESRFNSMFAVKSIDTAIQYYKEFEKQLAETGKNIKIAVIFSADDSRDEEQAVENEETEEMEQSHKEFLKEAIEKYKKTFGWKVGEVSFNDYRNDVSRRVKEKEIDILIVVNMFLTGFDAHRLNTIWIDKHLEGHNLIQAFSRTNRIYNKSKPHGNIVCFRDIKKEVDTAIIKFAAHDSEDSYSLVTEPGFSKYLDEFKRLEDTLIEKFPTNKEIIGEQEEKEFLECWKRYSEITRKWGDDEDLEKNRRLTEADRQNYSSMYRGIYENYRELSEKSNDENYKPSEIEQFAFDLELLRSDEVNIKYILELLADYWKVKDKDKRRDIILRYVRTSSAFRPEEHFVKEFLEKVDQGNKDLNYGTFKRNKMEKEIEKLVQEEGLKPEGTKKFINKCVANKEISFDGIKAREEIMKDMDMIKEFRQYKKTWERVQGKIRNIFNLLSAW